MNKQAVHNYAKGASEKLCLLLNKPEYIFAILATFFGLIAVFIIPPGWNSDEDQHFFRVVQFTQGELFATDEYGGKTGRAGGYIDNSAESFISSVGRFVDNSESREKLLPFLLFKDSPRYSRDDQKTYVQFNGSALYSPLTYIPQIAGVSIVKVFNGPVYLSILLARLAGLALFVLALFWAIRIMPRGKWVVLTVALLPTSVVQAAAFGADAVTFSSIALFISYVFYLAYNKIDLTPKHTLLLTLLMVIVGLIKPTYFILLPLVLIIPLVNTKYFNFKFIVKLTGMMAIAALPAIIWIVLTNYVNHNGGEATNKELQMRHIINNPIEMILTIFRTYFGVTESGTRNHFFDVAFRNFVWDIVQFSKIYTYLAVIAIVLSLGIKDSMPVVFEKNRKILHHSLMIGVFIATFVVINIALYVHFTPVESRVVYGVQARYIFPFLILLLLPIRWVAKNQLAIKGWVVSISIVCLTASTIAIYQNIHHYVW